MQALTHRRRKARTEAEADEVCFYVNVCVCSQSWLTSERKGESLEKTHLQDNTLDLLFAPPFSWYRGWQSFVCKRVDSRQKMLGGDEEGRGG